ncbi:MAG: efflux RND transporter permease subunit [Desulfobacterales bacterium]
MTAVVRFALRFRGAIIALAAMLLVYGFYTLPGAEYDVFPEFAPPQVVIRVEAPGLSPQQVEVLVTAPVEHAIEGVEGVASLRSHSLQGLAAITVIFRTGSDIYRARQLVAERLASLSQPLPHGITPFMSPLTSSASTVLQLGLASHKRSLMDLRTVADWTVKPRLLAVGGVAQVQIYGGQVRQLQIQLLPERLLQYNLSIRDVAAAAERATGVRGAGFIETENQRITLHTEGQSLVPDQLAATVIVRQEGANVTLGDVAEVVQAPAPPIGAASINGRPGVVLIVSSQYGANTLDVTRRLDRALKDLRPMLSAEDIELYPNLFRPATFIHTALHNVLTALEIGAALVVVVLILFLFNFRTAAISFTAIPLSLLTAITVLDHLGFSLNVMSLGGLAVAVGEAVDDAVIDVENIFRRLRENRNRVDPRPVLAVVLAASIEVRSAVVFATFTVVLVFLPVLTLSGVAGHLFAPLGIAYILAVLASLGVALTVTPALSLILLGHREPPRREPPVVRWTRRHYQDLLGGIENHPRLVPAATAVFIAAGLAVLPFLSGGFLPVLREGSFIVHVTAVPGTSLQESLRLGDRISEQLLKLPYVEIVSQKTGRAQQGASIRGIGSSEIDVNLKPGRESQFRPSEVRKLLSRFPGINFAVHTFLTERIGETISGYAAPVVVNIFGNDLDMLDRKGGEIARVLAAIPGAADVRVQAVPEAPQVMVRLRKEDLTRWGFRPVEVLDAVHAAYQGMIVGQIYEQERIFDVAVILNPRNRISLTPIGRLPLRNSTGTYILLQELADIYEGPGRYMILHDGGRRVQTVTCSLTQGSLNSFVAEARQRIHSIVSLPAGTYLEFAGVAESEAGSKRDLYLHALLAGAGIILLLFIVLGNYRNVLLLLLNLPFALVGGIAAILLTGEQLSLGAMIGFVTVFGITLRNSIMMISHYRHLVNVEGLTWGLQTAIRGASERLTPILMTAFVTGLGLLPLAVGVAAPGREIEGRMAIVILGGLITSTLLNLLVLPTLALKYGRFKANPER